MRKFINVLLVLLAVAYLFEAITVGVFLDASIDISTGAYIVAALALLIWLVCVLLEGKMTQLQAIVTMAITVCNLCAMLPVLVSVIFPSWRMWVFIFLGISVGLSPLCSNFSLLSAGVPFAKMGCHGYWIKHPVCAWRGAGPFHDPKQK